MRLPTVPSREWFQISLTLVADLETSGSTTDISAYMAIDEPNQDIIIGVRGSSNLYNWVTDLRFLQTSCEYGVACRAHRGFLDAAQDIIDDNFYDSVRDALKDYPRANITVSGHSLGGAVALLLGVYIRENWPKRTVHIYTYGAPRVGNVPFMNYIHNQENGRTFRITHFDDVVPRLPPMSYLDYGHSSAEYWLPYGPADRVDYTEDQVVECTGYDNSDCSGSGWYPGLRSHLYYLVAITHCGGSHSRLSLGNSPIESWNGTALDKDAIERLEMFALMDQQYAAAVAYISDQDS